MLTINNLSNITIRKNGLEAKDGIASSNPGTKLLLLLYNLYTGKCQEFP